MKPLFLNEGDVRNSTLFLNMLVFNFERKITKWIWSPADTKDLSIGTMGIQYQFAEFCPLLGTNTSKESRTSEKVIKVEEECLELQNNEQMWMLFF